MTEYMFIGLVLGNSLWMWLMFKKVNKIEEKADWNVEDLNEKYNRLLDDGEAQREVNRLMAEDIMKLQDRLDKIYGGLVSVNNWQDSVKKRFEDIENKGRKVKKS